MHCPTASLSQSESPPSPCRAFNLKLNAPGAGAHWQPPGRCRQPHFRLSASLSPSPSLGQGRLGWGRGPAARWHVRHAGYMANGAAGPLLAALTRRLRVVCVCVLGGALADGSLSGIGPSPAGLPAGKPDSAAPGKGAMPRHREVLRHSRTSRPSSCAIPRKAVLGD